METIKLRAHHGMCPKFFEGKGYDEKFALHMTVKTKSPRMTEQY